MLKAHSFGSDLHSFVCKQTLIYALLSVLLNQTQINEKLIYKILKRQRNRLLIFKKIFRYKYVQKESKLFRKNLLLYLQFNKTCVL